jgi:hypothetical protein
MKNSTTHFSILGIVAISAIFVGLVYYYKKSEADDIKEGIYVQVRHRGWRRPFYQTYGALTEYTAPR